MVTGDTVECVSGCDRVDGSWGQELVGLRYDTRCYFNVRSKADASQLNLPHGNDN